MFTKSNPHSDLSKAKMREKLLNHHEKKMAISNQPITIRDLAVHAISRSGSFGESRTHFNPHQKLSSRKRLLKHAESLIHFANTYHKNYYCDSNKNGIYTTKKDCLNKITRILLPEFSLYTQKPLSMDHFISFRKSIEKIAAKQQPNVHILLSSMAVTSEDNTILNMSLYIQCGQEPKIEAFCKSIDSNSDIQYPRSTLFSKQDHRTYYKNGELNRCKYIASQSGNIISGNNVFIVKTEGGAEFVQAIDVCLEHLYEIAKNKLKDIIGFDDPLIIPDQADHILTSNTIKLIESSGITSPIVHVDPVNSFNNSPHIMHPMKKQDVVTRSDLKLKKTDPHCKTTIKKHKDGFVVYTPYFGSDYNVFISDERNLNGFTRELRPEVKKHNDIVKNNILKSRGY